MKILAIDWGKKYFGLAVSESGVLVRELPAIPASIKNLVETISREKPQKIVIGLPTTPDGALGPQAKIVRGFAEKLSKFVNIPLEFEDEAFTSSEANRLGGDHSTAARLILEQNLNNEKTKN